MTYKNKLIATYVYIIFMYVLNIPLFFLWMWLGTNNAIYYLAAAISVFGTVYNAPGVYGLIVDLKNLRKSNDF